MKTRTINCTILLSFKLLMITAFLNLSSCSQQEGSESPADEISQQSLKLRAADFGRIHNKSMNSILNDIKSRVRGKETLKKASIEPSSGYFQLASYEQTPDFDLNDAILETTFESVENEGISIPSQIVQGFRDNAELIISDEIHNAFNSNITGVRNAFTELKNQGSINSIDLNIIQDIVSLSYDVNDAFINPNNSNVSSIEYTFQSRLNQILTSFELNEQSHGPITTAIVSIVEGSRDYWMQQNLEGEPGIIPASSENYDFIIPVFLARIIIKDALGALSSLITSGFAKRILNGDWDFDTSKLTEDEQLVAILVGAIASSGGFLGKWALRVLLPV